LPTDPWEQTLFPAIVVAPHERVVVSATRCAHAVLGHPPGTLAGRSTDDLVADSPVGGMNLLAAGELEAFEVTRTISATGERRRAQVRVVPFPDGPAVVAHLLPQPHVGRDMARVPASVHLTTVGGLRSDASIGHVSQDVQDLLGHSPEYLLTRPLVDLVAQADRCRVHEFVDAALRRGRVASTVARFRTAGGEVSLKLVLLPYRQPGTAVFLLVPSEADARRPLVGPQGAQALLRLTPREAEIATALAAGDRVPAIAVKLSLSQGTVRNYLSSAFRKLGVATQQELIDLIAAR
jgi:DNA-binding CsgD family transcriptional regulator/PAS domain-containing protein